jgi:hypothetical protein
MSRKKKVFREYYGIEKDEAKYNGNINKAVFSGFFDDYHMKRFLPAVIQAAVRLPLMGSNR